MKAWLKGGLIGGIIGFVLIILPVYLLGGYWPTAIGYLSFYLGMPWTVYVSEYNFRVIISVLINFFLIGALIGFIIGKIKSKK